jgi:hypothetical protein
LGEATLKFPRDKTERERMRALIDGLSSKAFESFHYSAKVWTQTVDDGREVIGVLNQRYELCVLECSPPAPWFAVAFDTRTRELIVAQDFANGGPVSCEACAKACAAALGEAANFKCYPESVIHKD